MCIYIYISQDLLTVLKKALILNLETPFAYLSQHYYVYKDVYKDVHPKAHQPSNFNDNVHPLHMLQLHITDGLAAVGDFQQETGEMPWKERVLECLATV